MGRSGKGHSIGIYCKEIWLIGSVDRASVRCWCAKQEVLHRAGGGATECIAQVGDSSHSSGVCDAGTIR